MQTKYLGTTEQDIKIAAEIIKKGGLVAFPTETVYGLGGDAMNPEAARKIYAAKGRPSDNPLIVHVADSSEMSNFAKTVTKDAEKLTKLMWPCPLTVVLPKKEIVPLSTTGGLNTVAMRCPANETALRLIKLSGTGIAAPSANLSGRPSPTHWEHVKHDLDGKIDAIIMGEACSVGIESTVLDMTGENPQILRPGFITPEMITEKLNKPCSYDPAILGSPDENLVPKAPGMKYKHYAPKAEMILFAGSPENVKNAIHKKAGELRNMGRNVKTIFYSDAAKAAAGLFTDLRAADEEGADIILASALPTNDSFNYSVMNRMLKSCGYNVVEV